ncbi:hypothetical protein F4553_007512 [Allocatelliglobosispora scoriae]|uniref:ESAT-6 protein secretion system EspG family protein n=1 Tax=Allocatelliglobosispora scoriae TaxID=643052 RepID=A0A841C2T4_9ACTN|nr:hypothetical protein [Allocatelliglobosispora scoriae]MBB5874078.1 hypothetical protein [Allocatelliglobosispora scoriae]
MQSSEEEPTARLGMTASADRVSFTAAELSYLIASSPATTPLGGRAAQVIGLTDAERGEAAISAGFSSLIVRGLAVSDGERVTYAPATGAVSEAVTKASVCVQLGLISADKSDGAVLFDSGRARLLVTPRKHRCFDVTGMNRTLDVGGQLLAVARQFLERNRPGVVSFAVDTTGSGVTEDIGWVTAAADNDTWSVVFSREPSDADRGLSESEAVERLQRRLHQLLPVA